jgi:NADPH:quinone reductase-like Zn-dependent oxidoreductase
MKAIVIEQHGGPEVLRYQDVPDPQPRAGEVVIRVRALTVNPGPDVQTREGRFGLPGFALPHVGGSDPAGEVVAVGDGVTTHEVGDRVVVYPILWCGECDFCRSGVGENYCRRWRLWGAQTWGGRAEYARVPAVNLVALPDSVSWEAAATLPISYITTWHGIVDKGGLSERDTLLVMGAAGGCGVAATQIGRLYGARVFTVSGAAWKRARSLELGAEHAFDYHDDGWPAQLRELTDGRGASIVFDNVGQATWPQSISCLDRGGRFVCSGVTTGSAMAFDALWTYRNMISMHFHIQGRKANLEQLVGLIADGRLEPVIDSRFPLAQIADAERKLAAQDHFGKIVVTPPSPGVTDELETIAAASHSAHGTA